MLAVDGGGGEGFQNPMTTELPANSSDTFVDDSLIEQVVAQVRDSIARRQPVLSTYRLQFTGSQFRFSDATTIADYLAQLGVSHVYSSPILKATEGSTHGYDVVDPTRLNDELGSEDEFGEWMRALRANRLGQILDIVPNHMGVASDSNKWWMDVLANGPSSPYAHYFDLEWRPVKRELRNRVLLPVLGDLYGKTLESGQLPIGMSDGRFYVQVYERRLPLEIRTWVQILQPGMEELTSRMGTESLPLLELQSIIRGLEHLPGPDQTEPANLEVRRREQVVLHARLQRLLEESPEIADFVEGNIRRINGEAGTPESFDALDRLLESQVYRLVMWKAGSDELNYRRFFDVTELAAVSTAHLDVFEAIHRLPFEMVLRGEVDGFRIDHVDGLFDPTEYLWRLQWTLLRQLARLKLQESSTDGADRWSQVEPIVLQRLRGDLGGPDPLGLLQIGDRNDASVAIRPDDSAGAHRSKSKPLFVLVEKILGADEPLPPHWPVEGTTGYDFLNPLNGVLLDAAGLRKVEQSYKRYIDAREDLPDIIYHSKRLILSAAMQSEVALLAHRLDRLSNRHRNTRDYTLQSLRSAIREIIASFHVYRTYIRSGQISERDRRVVQLAAAHARRRNPAVDESVIQFVRDVLLLEQPPALSDAGREEREAFIGRFQQVTSPVMAKGVEDTAFYRYVPLVSLEEVGGEPGHAPPTVSEFHRHNAARSHEWPHTMLATSTHDTKRSEDLRARLDVLTEIPGEWQKAVSRWTRFNRKFHRDVDGEPGPTRNDEWLFYQAVLGIWPLSPPSEQEMPEIVSRLQRYMEKASREAKLSTSWISPNSAYDDALKSFVAEVLDSRNSRFLTDFAAFHESVVDSGLFNAVSQLTLKLTAPGFPDVYQGQETWDFSLVDPDNRRPVDYERRRWLLGEVNAQAASADSRLALCQNLAANPRDDRFKLFVTAALLKLRRQLPDVFLNGDYAGLETSGEKAEHVVAFVRRSKSSPGEFVIVVAPRLVHRLVDGRRTSPTGESVWAGTTVLLPGMETTSVVDHFTGQSCQVENGRILLSEALAHFPVAALTATAAPWQ